MKVSVKSDYAARAVMGLARHFQKDMAVRVEDWRRSKGSLRIIWFKFSLIKSQSIVRSQRGKEGGYLLARPPAEITLGDILRCVHGQVFDSPALTDSRCPAELRAAWKKLQGALEGSADSITFQQLLEESTGREKMYYI